MALTRAADDLVVTSAATRNGRSSNPSRWLAAVAATTADHELTVPAEPMVRQPAPIDPLKALREWRAAVARAARVAPTDLCSDRVLRSLHDDPPTDTAALARRLGLTESAAARLRPLPER